MCLAIVDSQAPVVKEACVVAYATGRVFRPLSYSVDAWLVILELAVEGARIRDKCNSNQWNSLPKSRRDHNSVL